MGALGHSTGGGAAIQFCAENEDCRLAVGLDPWLAPVSDAVVASGMSQPGLFLFSDPQMAYFEPKNRQRFDLFAANVGGLLCALTIAGTGHHDFDDTGTFSPAARFLGYNKGPIPINRSFEIINAYTLAFLDQTLKNSDTTLFDGPSHWFPEVTLDCAGPDR